MGTGTSPRVIAAGAIGNVLEWYDFAVYGYFASAIGHAFFPKEDPVAQVLSAFGIFAVGIAQGESSHGADSSSYWRCQACGQVWNVGRLRPAHSQGHGRWS